MAIKDQIREIVLSFGADFCGIANIDRFAEAPSGFSPIDIYPDCKSVISYAIALPMGLTQITPRLIYGHYNYMSCPEADLIALKSAKKIESDFKCVVVPVPCDTPYEYWDDEGTEGRGLLSMKHIAVQAGLGSIGKSTLFLNKRYGNMVTLGAMLTSLDLTSDPLSGGICVENCHKCIDACPVGAIDNGSVNQKLCRANTYGKTKRGFDTVDCNICRTTCPLNARQ